MKKRKMETAIRHERMRRWVDANYGDARRAVMDVLYLWSPSGGASSNNCRQEALVKTSADDSAGRPRPLVTLVRSRRAPGSRPSG